MMVNRRKTRGFIGLLICIILAGYFGFSLPKDAPENRAIAAPLADCGNFSDVFTTSDSYEGVQFYDCRNVAHGYYGSACTTSPCFLPNNNLTRGQLAKIITISHDFCCYIPPGAPRFVDVATTDPFYQYVETATWFGLMDPSLCDGTGCYFRPYDFATRGQAAHAVIKGARYRNAAYSSFFPDVTTYTPYRADIETAYARGLLGGRPGVYHYTNTCMNPPQYENVGSSYFRPCESLTRGQLAKMDVNARFYHTSPYPGTFNWEQDAFNIYFPQPGLRTIPSGYVDFDATWNPGPPIQGPFNYYIDAYNIRWSSSAKQWIVNNENGGQYKVGIVFNKICTSGSYFTDLYFSVPNAYRWWGRSSGDCGNRMLVSNPSQNITANAAYYAYTHWTDGGPTLTDGWIGVGNVQVDTTYVFENEPHRDYLSGERTPRNDLCYTNGLGMRKCP